MMARPSTSTLNGSASIVLQACNGARNSLARHSCTPSTSAITVQQQQQASIAINRRSFSTANSVQAKARQQNLKDDSLSLDNMGKFQYDDLSTRGHIEVQRRRELLHYARLVEWELPKIAADMKKQQEQKPFTPPSKEQILRLRSLHYQGAPHPVTRKSVLTVDVRDVFDSGVLTSHAARKKFLLLAGVRWNPWKVYNDATRRSTTDAQLDVYALQSDIERIALNNGVGSIKISCERFPIERMNVKWCSDAIDSLISEANIDAEAMQDVPLDLRHVKAREESRKGFERHYAPSLRNFPKQWLPGNGASSNKTVS